jgi:hypothetical protein
VDLADDELDQDLAGVTGTTRQWRDLEAAAAGPAGPAAAAVILSDLLLPAHSAVPAGCCH